MNNRHRNSDAPPAWAFPGHQWITEPQLAFHAEREEDCHTHPLKGLLQFGPYGRSLYY